MAVTAVGFEGTVDEVQWARMAPELGDSERIVSGLTAAAVSGGTRQVTISAGTAYAYGVMVTVSPAETLTFGNVTTGVRWDTVVIRRNWSTNTASLAVVPGGSTESLPASLNSNPGVVHDQAIALVQISAGVTVPSAVRSLSSQPRTQTLVFARSISTGNEDNADVPTGEYWPNSGGFDVYVPRWAREVSIVYAWYGVNNQSGNASGGLSVEFGSQISSETSYSAAGSDQNRMTLGVAQTLTIDPASKGRVVLLAGRATGPSTGITMRLDAGSSLSAIVTFRE